MHPKDLRIEDFTYSLPDERIAKHPLAERDASRLLVYEDGNINEDIYRYIAERIPASSLMVFNQTKVVHARLLFKKESGSVIEVFCLSPAGNTDIQTAMLQKGSAQWECLIGGASKWKHGMVLQIAHEGPHFTLSAKIVERTPTAYIVQLEWDNDTLTFAEVLHSAGKVPLPPYLHREAAIDDESRYQTVFAKEEGSVAAPTAGLHFTNDVLQSLNAKNIDTSFVTLHVGAGTFKPVKSETMAAHDMHAEWIEVTPEAIQQLIQHLDKGIVAVGTTSLRTLESLYWVGNKLLNGATIDWHGVAVGQWEPYEQQKQHVVKDVLLAISNYMSKNSLNKLITRTQILIAPGYSFRVVTGLITNFHQPQSTLLLLVAAFIGEDWRKVYEYAMNNGFRFLSYGDGCLLWRNARNNDSYLLILQTLIKPY
ncbi:MAG: S-adenosylmethionine:tRNA ribosyltransferase-isomerase [Flavipsychrobacter sp.]|jgi:S-adenosylmethionine:tRNA ribosyltransferase-isomerase|nr:S-adenosylmethionine:tRNA ribosyltransferase-isomerase [Flavipsychrobacter sp.]